jgi:predicted TPR repeat methyltransferase
VNRPEDLVAAGYDAISERYAAWQSAVEGDPRAAYVERLLALLPTEPNILEIGCGAGIEPTPTFARLGRLTGVDISRAQIERARVAVPDATFAHQDITTATFATCAFDAVVALYVLTHIPLSDLNGLLGRIASWLKPSGLFLATFGTGRTHEDFVDDFLGAPMFFAGHDEATNERLVEDAGMTVIESRVEDIHEPESEPGRGAVTASFHWLLARKAAARAG